MITFDNEKINSICKKNRVLSLYLIGSQARDDHSDESDLDFLVNFEKTTGALDQYFSTLEELEKLTGTHVDLIEEEAIKNKSFKSGTFKDRILLYEA